MEMLNKYVIPYLENGYIKYLSDGVAKTMSAEYFQKNFTQIAASELPNIGQRYFFYQNKENPEFVMRFRISQNVGFSAAIMLYNEFEKQFSVIGNL